MQLFAIKLVSFKNKCIFKIVIFYVLLATSWFVITAIPVLLSVLPPKVSRSIVVSFVSGAGLAFNRKKKNTLLLSLRKFSKFFRMIPENFRPAITIISAVDG